MEQTRWTQHPTSLPGCAAWPQGEAPQWQSLLLFMNTLFQNLKWNIARTTLLQNAVQTFADYEAGEYWYHHFTDRKVRQNKWLVASDR